ncbi:MAG: hypothetical protein E7A62_06055 [Actinomycetaceae bacterium]|nr:hypothetical protein [Actinomycetaceae bacterium]MDU0970543.1 hypothetical protein [Actinomycetaceae bacterium]
MTTSGPRRPGSRPPRRPGSGGRPQAPRRPSASVYRRRRIGVLIVSIIAITLLVLAVRAVIQLGSAAISAKSSAESSSTGPNPSVQVTDCTASLLDGTLTPDGQRIQPGWKVTVKAHVAAKDAKTPCIAQGSPAKLGMRVLHGDQTVYDSTTCAEDAPKRLLFGRDLTWDTTFAWDGHAHLGQDGNCQAADVVDPGVYTLRLVYDGKLVGQPTELTVEGGGQGDSSGSGGKASSGDQASAKSTQKQSTKNQ